MVLEVGFLLTEWCYRGIDRLVGIRGLPPQVEASRGSTLPLIKATADYNVFTPEIFLGLAFSAIFAAGVIAGAYYLIPREVRKKRVRYRLPVILGCVQIVLALYTSLSAWDNDNVVLGLSFVLNAPAYILFFYASEWLSSDCGPVASYTVWAIACTVYWVISVPLTPGRRAAASSTASHLP